LDVSSLKERIVNSEFNSFLLKANDYEEIYRQIGGVKTEHPKIEDIEFVKDNLGEIVNINNTNVYGIIKGLNISTYGITTGRRLPIKVEFIYITDDPSQSHVTYNTVGETYEFCKSQLTLKNLGV
jgi:hypothetical protein